MVKARCPRLQLTGMPAPKYMHSDVYLLNTTGAPGNLNSNLTWKKALANKEAVTAKSGWDVHDHTGLQNHSASAQNQLEGNRPPDCLCWYFRPPQVEGVRVQGCGMCKSLF